MASRFRDLTTHGLLSDTEEKLVNESLRSLGKRGSGEVNRILENIRTNSELKRQIESIEVRIDRVNNLLASNIVKLKANEIQLSEETTQLWGIRLTRDSWVSVVYSEGLNSATSSVTLRSTGPTGDFGTKACGFSSAGLPSLSSWIG
jgi:hypothetical protein